jgi:ATP/maltotriose-dependent transcriptional regulator MalT
MTVTVSPFTPCRSQQLSHSSSLAEHELALNQADLLGNICADHLWSEIADALQCGILVVSPEVRLLYANAKAQELCQHLIDSYEELSVLPQLIVEICDRWSKANLSGTKSLVMECRGRKQQTIRATVQRLPQSTKDNQTSNGVAPILVLLENCDEKFKMELLIQCKRYGLTEREAEVWNLLKQGYAYQEVAGILGVSMNTIKTHAKNIHNKRRGYQQSKQTVWFSR